MAVVHVYVRVQVTGTEEQCMAIADATDALQAAVEDAGGAWRGSAQIDHDPEIEEPETREKPETSKEGEEAERTEPTDEVPAAG